VVSPRDYEFHNEALGCVDNLKEVNVRELLYYVVYFVHFEKDVNTDLST
jgi:hypothetical protein